MLAARTILHLQRQGRQWLCCLLLVTIPLSSVLSQAVNNNIANRSVLTLDDSVVSSSTNEATVEWQCINKALTQKCLVYHNDQWFTFGVPASGKYYLNISAQQCRDGRGVQALIIEGNPCEVKTYRVIRCIPSIRKEDVFITLDSLKAGLSYLVNIDGFLGDYCSFNIQVSTRPQGLSETAVNLDTAETTIALRGKVVSLQWQVDAVFADELNGFEINRFHHLTKQTVLVDKLIMGYNALGHPQTLYDITDTISAGTYTYEILGTLKSGEKQILSRKMVTYKPKIINSVLTVALDYKRDTKLQSFCLIKFRAMC